MANGEAFVFGRTDWQYVFNTFCYGYRVGYRFIETKEGMCNGNFLGIGADDCDDRVVGRREPEVRHSDHQRRICPISRPGPDHGVGRPDE